MGFWAVVAIGVGGMVGGGIFAVLGLSVQLTAGGAPVAFAALVWETARGDARRLLTLVVMAALAFGVELAYRHLGLRRPR